MRERTTWTRSAAQNKVADPYLMNQDHVSQQPKADDYVIGDPSTFAEDVHPSKDTWEAEYAGGQVKRNEIGMAEMRADTFKHPEKTAVDQALLLKKADLCIKTAGLMLRTANETAIEDQAVALMSLPNTDLISTYTRLAHGEQEAPVAMYAGAQAIQAAKLEAAQQQVASLTQQAQKCMAQGDFQAAQKCMAQAQDCMAQAQAPQGQKLAQQEQEEQQAQEQEEQQAQEQEEQQAQAKQAQAKQAQAQGQQGEKKEEEPKAQAKKAQQIQSEQIQAAVQHAVQQVMAQMMGQQAQQAPQESGMGSMADDQALADLLMTDPGMDAEMSEMGIEMEPAPMDVGEISFAPEDDVLMTLFANDQDQAQGQKEQDQAQQAQAKQAMSRTASTRTVGTRPTQGVSRVGSSPAVNANSDINRLAALWPSAPDVSDAFR